MTTSTAEIPPPIPTKKKGPIRWGAVIPLSLIALSFFLYGKFLFDSHLKKIITFGLEGLNKAEVNLKSAQLSLFKGTLALRGLEITNRKKPTHNLLAIGKMSFSLNTKELLKAKILVEKSEVLDIQWNSLRKKPGKLFNSSKENKVLSKSKKVILNTAGKEFQGNVLGDAANIIAGETSTKSKVKEIKETLVTEQKIEELENKLKEDEKRYKNLLTNLKSEEDLAKIKKEVESFKWSKKNPLASLKKVKSLINLTNSKIKYYRSEYQKIEKDARFVSDLSKNIEGWIEEDMERLQKRSGIPKLNSNDLAYSLFSGFFGSKVQTFTKYSKVAKEYMPPPKSEREKRNIETQIKPKERHIGKNFLFPKKGENPKYWIKEVLLSSQSGSSEFGGNLKGSIKNISSSQSIIDRPTTIHIQGEFPKQKIRGVNIVGTLDHRTSNSKQDFRLKVKEYPFPSKKLSGSKDLALTLNKSPASLSFRASNTKNNEEKESTNIQLLTAVSKPKFTVEAKKKVVKEIVENSLSGMKNLNISAQAYGGIDSLKWKFKSNIGDQLSKGFKAAIQQKVENAKKELKRKILEKIEPKKQGYLNDINKIKNDFKTQVSKEKGQVTSQFKSILSKLSGLQKKSIKNNPKIKKKTKELKGKAKKLLKKFF